MLESKTTLPDVIKHIRSIGVAVDGEMAKKIKRLKAHKRQTAQTMGVDADMRGSYGELLQICEQHTKAALKDRDVFHPHCTYVLGKPFADSPTEEEIKRAEEVCTGLPHL